VHDPSASVTRKCARARRRWMGARARLVYGSDRFSTQHVVLISPSLKSPTPELLPSSLLARSQMLSGTVLLILIVGVMGGYYTKRGVKRFCGRSRTAQTVPLDAQNPFSHRSVSPQPECTHDMTSNRVSISSVSLSNAPSQRASSIATMVLAGTNNKVSPA
jgi:hypothetical protein